MDGQTKLQNKTHAITTREWNRHCFDGINNFLGEKIVGAV